MSAVGAGEEVVPASEYRALQSQVRELQRLLGKKTLDNEILREAWDLAQPKKRANTKPAASSPKLTTAASAAAELMVCRLFAGAEWIRTSSSAPDRDDLEHASIGILFFEKVVPSFDPQLAFLCQTSIDNSR